MQRAPRCLARTRRGTPCQAPAMPNGRCRMHGGKSRRGAQHGRYRHGRWTQQAQAERRLIRTLLSRAQATLDELRQVPLR
jgi:hypothetical protein